jgi:hypothetical protein
LVEADEGSEAEVKFLSDEEKRKLADKGEIGACYATSKVGLGHIQNWTK